MAEDNHVPIFRPGDVFPNFPPSDYDEIQYGYRTPDGEEHFSNELGVTFPSGTRLDTAEGQQRAQEAFERAVRKAGIAYDPEIHGKLEFLMRTVSHRTHGSVPLYPSKES